MPDSERFDNPYRIRTKLEKRRAPEEKPYEVIEDKSWHEADGTEITDAARIEELDKAQADREQCLE